MPNEAALTALAEVGAPLLEMGAGSGYWAMLLRERGVEVLAYDISPPHSVTGQASGVNMNIYHSHTWTEVLEGSIELLEGGAHADRALFLSWPVSVSDSNDGSAAPWDVECLDAFAGNTVCYVGTFNVGSPSLVVNPDLNTTCSSDAFQLQLQATFDLVQTVELPTWPLMEDTLTIWKRKP